MSHFTVMVKMSEQEVQDKGFEQAVCDKLAKYDENKAVEPYKIHIKQSEVDQVMSTYKDELNEGPITDEVIFECLSEYYLGIKGKAGKDEKGYYYLSTYNPDSKWDWYQLGGRWSGMLKIKEGVNPEEVFVGSPGLMGSSYSTESNRVDACKVKYLDIEAIEQEGRKQADSFWDGFDAYRLEKDEEVKEIDTFSLRLSALDLGLIQVKSKDQVTDDDRKNFIIREFGNDADGVDLISKVDYKEFMETWWFKFTPLVTYAIVDNDGWHAPGEMGWFGCSSDTADDKKEFIQNFKELAIEKADPDTWLAIMDCHI